MSASCTSSLAWTFGLDPMMRKESFGLSRRWQTYLFRALYVGFLGLAVWFAWQGLSAKTGWVSYSDYTEFGRGFFNRFSVVQYGLVILFALAAASDMISKEVRTGTLGVLALTPLGPRMIVHGKWKSCLGYQTLVLLSGVPLLALGIYFGGVSGEELVAVTALSFATAALASAIAILFSAYLRNPYVSVMMAVLGLLIYAVAPVPPVVVFDRMFELDGIAASVVSWMNPVFSWFAARNAAARLPLAAEHSWMGASVAGGVLSWLLLHVAERRIARLVNPREELPVVWRRARRAVPVIHHRPRRDKDTAELAGVWDFNPCLWREMRQGAGRGLRLFTWASLAGLVVVALLGAVVGPGADNAVMVRSLYGAIIALMLLAGIAAGSSAFTRDKEGNRWEVLLSTPLTANQIIGAKLLASLAAVGPHGLALVVLTVAATHMLHRPLLAPVVVCAIVFAAFSVALGVLLSLWAPNTRRARSLTLAVVLLLLGAIPAAASAVELSTSGSAEAADACDFVVHFTNPFAYLGTELRSWEPQGPVEAEIFVFVLFYSMLSTLAVGACRAGFNRLSGRAG